MHHTVTLIILNVYMESAHCRYPVHPTNHFHNLRQAPTPSPSSVFLSLLNIVRMDLSFLEVEAGPGDLPVVDLGLAGSSTALPGPAPPLDTLMPGSSTSWPSATPSCCCSRGFWLRLRRRLRLPRSCAHNSYTF